MKDVKFLNDVLSKGAILGIIMLASGVIEESVITYKGTIGWLSFMAAEYVFFVAMYIFLIYRYTKNYSLAVMAQQNDVKLFSFGAGMAYVVSLVVLAGIITVLGTYLNRHFIIGYDTYIAGYIKMSQNLLSTAQIPSSMASTYEQMFKQLSSVPEPTLIKTIMSSLVSYIVRGTILGLIIASIVKREPTMFDNTSVEK